MKKLLAMLLCGLFLVSCGKPAEKEENKDENRNFLMDGSYVEVTAVPSELALQSAAKKVHTVVDTYLSADTKVYYGIVPDKHYYTDTDWDYSFFRETLRENLADYGEISLWDSLAFSDYYKADLHWKQESLHKVVQTLCTAMDAPAPVGVWTENLLFEAYRGSYAKTEAEDDRLIYLTSDMLNGVTVSVLDSNTLEMVESAVYDLAQKDSHDMYNIFLSGAMPLITLENPNATGDKSLVVFRDSFTSSLAPLLTESYKTVTLVDLRYIVSKLLPDYVDFSQYDDALFLYSVPIWSNSTALKVFA